MVKISSKKVHLDPNDPKITSIKGKIYTVFLLTFWILQSHLWLQDPVQSVVLLWQLDTECAVTSKLCTNVMKFLFTNVHVDLSTMSSLPVLEAEASACKICGRKFLTTFAIQRHMRRVHPDDLNDSLPFRNVDGDNPSSCLFCFKSFSGKQSLDRHLRIVHQREYSCI